MVGDHDYIGLKYISYKYLVYNTKYCVTTLYLKESSGLGLVKF